METLLLPDSTKARASARSPRFWQLVLFLSVALLPSKLLADSGIYEAYIILNSKKTRSIYYDLNPGTQTGNSDFNRVTFGSFSTDESFMLKGAEVKTFKNGGCNVKNARIHYLVYAAGNRTSHGIL